MTELRSLTPDELAEITDAEVILDNDKATRADWLTMRRSYIGGSDAAGLLGLSPWTSPYGLWSDKTGRTGDDNDDGSTRLRAGSFLEPFVISEAIRQRPDLTVARAPYMLRHPDEARAMLAVNLDGIAWLDGRADPGILEAKTSEVYMADEWVDGPPVYYMAQITHAAAVTGLRWAAVAVMHGLGTVDVHIIDLDPEAIETVAEAGAAWWHRHVVADVAPEVDATDATTTALQEITPDTSAVVDLDADGEEQVAELMAELVTLAETAKATEDADKAVRNRIRALMGEAVELVGPTGRWATWRRSRGRKVTDWQALAHEMAAATRHDTNAVADLIDKHTTTKPGTRTLRVDAGTNRIKKDQKP